MGGLGGKRPADCCFVRARNSLRLQLLDNRAPPTRRDWQLSIIEWPGCRARSDVTGGLWCSIITRSNTLHAVLQRSFRQFALKSVRLIFFAIYWWVKSHSVVVSIAVFFLIWYCCCKTVFPFVFLFDFGAPCAPKYTVHVWSLKQTCYCFRIKI